MSAEGSAENENFLESLRSLLKVSHDHEKSTNELESSIDTSRTNDSENYVEIPHEQQIEPATRVEPLKSMVEPDYVRKVIRQIDTMSSEQLKEALIKIKVSTGGSKKTLRKRVAQYYRKENALLSRKIEPVGNKTLRHFDYLIATDFECTCVEVIYDYPHEIIEIPAVLIDVRDKRIISEFRTYVRPVRNPVLSDFCVEFTKIAQETVDEAPYFREALEKLFQWMRKFGLGDKKTRFAFVTDGPHDMWKFMQFQCLLSNLRMPHMFRNFVNIKKTYKENFNLVKGNGKSGIENMLDGLGLSFVGNKHSGLDDARNIAQIVIHLMHHYELRINQKCSWIEPAAQTLKENDEELGDTVDLKSIDVSRRDFQLWLRRLPLKLSSVTRREFLSEEYLDCESCDELTDEKTDRPTVVSKMTIREVIEKSHEEKFEQITKTKDGFDIGESKSLIPQLSIKIDEDGSVDESEGEYEDYVRQMDILDCIGSSSSFSHNEEVDLTSVWHESGSDPEKGSFSAPLSLAGSAISQAALSEVSTVPTSSAVNARIDFDSCEDMNLISTPPRNSLASSNQSNRDY